MHAQIHRRWKYNTYNTCKPYHGVATSFTTYLFLQFLLSVTVQPLSMLTNHVQAFTHYVDYQQSENFRKFPRVEELSNSFSRRKWNRSTRDPVDFLILWPCTCKGITRLEKADILQSNRIPVIASESRVINFKPRSSCWFSLCFSFPSRLLSGCIGFELSRVFSADGLLR